MAEGEQPQFDPRKMPMIAGITLEEFSDELSVVLSDILYVDGLDQLPTIAASFKNLNDTLLLISAAAPPNQFLEVLTSIADRLLEIRDVLREGQKPEINALSHMTAQQVLDAVSRIDVPAPEDSGTFKPVRDV